MILQMISWFNVLYLTLQNCSLNIYKVIKIYKGVLYNALSNTKKNMNLTKFVWYIDIENWYYEEAYHELITPNSILKYQKQKLESYKVCMAYF